MHSCFLMSSTLVSNNRHRLDISISSSQSMVKRFNGVSPRWIAGHSFTTWPTSSYSPSHNLQVVSSPYRYFLWAFKSTVPVLIWKTFLAFADGNWVIYSCFCSSDGKIIFCDSFCIDALLTSSFSAKDFTLDFTTLFHLSLLNWQISSSVSLISYSCFNRMTKFPQFGSNGYFSCCLYVGLHRFLVFKRKNMM